MPVEKCEACRARSGRVNAKNYCCQIRELADSPKARRKAAYEAMLKSEGKESVNQVIADVNEELGIRRARQVQESETQT
jgi:hypothetical protein